MNRRDAIKKTSVLGFLGGLVGINVVPTKTEEIDKNELLTKTQGRDVLRALGEKLITEEEAKLITEYTKNPGHAYKLVDINKDNREWAERIIEQATFGDIAQTIFYMVKEQGSSREWAENIIEQTSNSVSPWYIQLMVGQLDSPREWAESIIEKMCKGEKKYTGSVLLAVCLMTNYGSSNKWAETLIEQAKADDKARAAYNMVYDKLSSREWAENIIENNVIGIPYLDMLYVIDGMVNSCGSSQKWAKKIKAKHA